MKILSFESSSASASVALTEGETLIAQSFQNCGLTHSRTLLPMAEAGKWMRNLFLLAAFSLEAGRGAGKRNYAVLNLLFVVTAVWFVSPIGINFLDVVCMLVYGAVIAVNLWRNFYSREQ